MQRKDNYGEKSRKANQKEYGASPAERLAKFPACPMARNVSSKPLQSLDKQYEQMFWVQQCGKNINQGQS